MGDLCNCIFMLSGPNPDPDLINTEEWQERQPIVDPAIHDAFVAAGLSYALLYDAKGEWSFGADVYDHHTGDRASLDMDPSHHKILLPWDATEGNRAEAGRWQAFIDRLRATDAKGPAALYTVQIAVDARDPKLIFEEALEQACVVDGLTAADARELLRPGGEIDVAACLQILLDPGESRPGMKILGSSCEAEAAL